MTQNTEQNVRTQSTQIAEIIERVTDLSLVNCYPDFGEVQDWIIEAEARGAAEQRRKDAEGQERWYFSEPDYHPQGMGCGLEDRGIHDRYEAMAYGWDQAVESCAELILEELYTHPANVAALEGRIAELEEAEASKAGTVWKFLTENISSDPELPSCRLNQMFQEGDSKQLIEETLAAFGIEACWDATQWDWQGPLEEMEELSADDLGKCDPRKDLTDAGWKLVDAWDTEDSEIVRMYVRPINAALTREGGV